MVMLVRLENAGGSGKLQLRVSQTLWSGMSLKSLAARKQEAAVVGQQGRDQRKRTQKTARSPTRVVAAVRVQARMLHQTTQIGTRVTTLLLLDRTTATSTSTQMKVRSQADIKTNISQMIQVTMRVI